MLEVAKELEDSPDKVDRDGGQQRDESISSSFDSSKAAHVDRAIKKTGNLNRRKTINLLKDPTFMSVGGEKMLKKISTRLVKTQITIGSLSAE